VIKSCATHRRRTKKNKEAGYDVHGSYVMESAVLGMTCQYAVAKALLGTGENERLDDMVPLKRIMIHEWHPPTPNSN